MVAPCTRCGVPRIQNLTCHLTSIMTATVTVTVPQDSNKCMVQSYEGAPPAKRQYRAGKPKGDKKQSERGCAPPQSVPVGGRLCQFVKEWKHITNDPYMLSIVLSF